MNKYILLLFMLICNSIHAGSYDSHPFNSVKESKRFHSLIKEIRCVVCQNQSIADSNSSLANDLREKIYKMMLEKKSNDYIKNYLSQRYGDFILLQPRLNKLTLTLWVFPFVGLMLIVMVLWRFKI